MYYGVIIPSENSLSCVHPGTTLYKYMHTTFPKKFVTFPGRQIAYVLNKKIFCTMLSVCVFLIPLSSFKTSRMAVQRPSINLSMRWFNDHHVSKK